MKQKPPVATLQEVSFL